MTQQLEETTAELEQTKMDLAANEGMKNKLLKDVEQLTETLHSKKALFEQQQTQLEQLVRDFQTTKSALESAEKECLELQDAAESWEKNAKAMEEEVVKTQTELSQVDEELSTTRTKFQETQTKLQAVEHQSRALEVRFAEEKETNEKALEATKEILTTRYQQQLQEQSTQFTRLLDEEKDASTKSSEQWKEEKSYMEKRFQQEMEKESQRSQEQQETMQKQITQLKEEVDNAKKEGEQKVKDIITKGKALISDTKQGFIAEMTKLDNENKALDADLDQALQEKREFEESMRQTVASLKQRLDQSTAQNNELMEESDQLQEQVKTMQEAKMKLQEDNDRYRRQMLGNGGNGRVGGQQYEKLQKEFNAVVEENRNLRRQARVYQDGGGVAASQQSGRNRGSTMTQMRQEYEDTIAALNDEKRELVMKNSAAITQVEIAEKRTWEREQEIAKLKAETTSLQLSLQRAEMAGNKDDDDEADKYFRSAAATSAAPSQASRLAPSTPPRPRASLLPSPKTPPSYVQQRKLRASRSPNIDKKLREKEQHEHMLRKHISSLRRTPPTKTLSPTNVSRTSTSERMDEGDDSEFMPPRNVKRVLSPRQDPNNNNTGQHDNDEQRDDAPSSSHYATGYQQPKQQRSMSRIPQPRSDYF
eukprot:CAMPEP_0172455560 /NCGR_PEP_ID=MMETSP1065-20121228/12127_1 /TAXON_ID=265537 /ORGANISM="Amphiprora paludosa, Strain CCMP125" /LENGTH=647 /DNA_ID=CAMNT_0013208025 /DNA_START=75 /DNA_END=2018 /DNA_ORIENTATION=-